MMNALVAVIAIQGWEQSREGHPGRPFRKRNLCMAEPTILVVDDLGRVRAVTADILNDAGFVVREARDGLDALAKAIDTPSNFRMQPSAARFARCGS